MRTDSLDYTLPEELIAQHPCERRDESRLLIVDRSTRSFHNDVFGNIGDYLRAGDCLVLNDTRVIHARIRGKKKTGGHIEIFLLHEIDPGTWEALVRPSSRLQAGARILLSEDIEATVGDWLGNGRRRVTFSRTDVVAVLERIGEIPLPPYIRRDAPDHSDLIRYQTIYARHPGAVAAPTAGLHFTDAIFQLLEQRGIHKTFVTLHVGYGTFRPVRVDTIEAHALDPEDFVVPETTASLLNKTRHRSGRVVAVGTTSTRVLESVYSEDSYHAAEGATNRFIYPPYDFHAVDSLITNFHLPRSSLLALVSAFAGTEFILEAYRYAVHERYRFYSYGDAMLIL